MPIEDEIRALKRELVGTSARSDAERTSAILAQLEARGVAGEKPVEKRGPGRPKKSE